MAIEEIERRFLVDAEKFKPEELSTYAYKAVQGYLPVQPGTGLVMRVRKCALPVDEDTETFNIAKLTIKQDQSYASCREFEYDIPVSDCDELLASCGSLVVHKTRHLLASKKNPKNKGVWEIDVFEKSLEGIIIAEIEIPSLDTSIVIPDFAILEITGNKALSNFRMAQYPEVAKTEIEYLLKNKV